MEKLTLNIVERLNLLGITRVARCGFQERKVLDNFIGKIEFSNEEIERADIHKQGENSFTKEKDFEKVIEVIEIEVKTLKRVVLGFAEQTKCVDNFNKSLFYKIDAFVEEEVNE